MCSAFRPRAVNETIGWSLRCEPGQLRKHSATAPMARVGCVRGSNGGRSVRIVSRHDSGTGGRDQPAGAERGPVIHGMTSVPSGPTASRSAYTTATGPPATQPIAESLQWTSTVVPGSNPRATRSAVSVRTVRGLSVRAMTSASPTHRPYRAGSRRSGEGRTRTGDPPVFSRVLYQLSYLAAGVGQSTQTGKRL